MMGLQTSAVHFAVHGRQVHQHVQDAVLNELVHERHGEVRGVGVGPGFGPLGVVVGERSHHQRRRPRTVGQGLEAVDVHHEVVLPPLRGDADGQTREMGRGVAKQRVHWMHDGGDVSQAFGVGAMAVGVEQDVTKIHGTSLIDGTHEPVAADRRHGRRVHIPSRGVGAAVSHQHGAQVHRTRQIGTMGDAVPFEVTMHDLKKRRKAPRGRLSVKVEVGLFLFEQVTNTEHAC